MQNIFKSISQQPQILSIIFSGSIKDKILFKKNILISISAFRRGRSHALKVISELMISVGGSRLRLRPARLRLMAEPAMLVTSFTASRWLES